MKTKTAKPLRFRFEEPFPPELNRAEVQRLLDDLARRTWDRVHMGWR